MTPPTTTQPPQECVLAVIRRHGVGLVGTAIRAIVSAALLGCVYAFVDTFVRDVTPWRMLSDWAFWLLVAAVAGWLLLGHFRPWASAELTITNYRVRISYRRRKPGWEIPLATILDVRTKSGLLSRLFGVGSLDIRTNFAPGVARMSDVPRVKATQTEILTLRNAYWSLYPWTRPVSAQEWNVRVEQ